MHRALIGLQLMLTLALDAIVRSPGSLAQMEPQKKKGAQLGLVPLLLSFRLSSSCSVLLASAYVCVFEPVTKTPVMATTSRSDA